MKMKQIQWPTLVVGSLGMTALGVLAVWGRQWGLSEEHHAEILTFLGTAGMLVLGYMRGVLQKKEDDE